MANATTVIERELREESRRQANFWLRLLAAGIVIAVFVAVTVGADLPGWQLGMLLFDALHKSLMAAFWIIVPLMTADCISREKREGTLGLLFLTPLSAIDVIVGKAGTHGLRSLTLFLAAMPVMGLPMVLGGVGWVVFVFAVLQQARAVLLGIAAGLYASSKGGTAVQAMVLAEAYALGLAVLGRVLDSVMGFAWGALGRPWRSWFFFAAGFAITLLLFALLLRATIRRVRATWHDQTATLDQPAWTKLFSNSDFWRSAFRWDKGHTLTRNPVAWLQEYSWTARLTKWGWCFLILAAELVALSDWADRRSMSWQSWITATLSLGLAFSAAGSFRRERETGLLELLLVSPLSVRRLVRGRLWGMLCHYAPAFAILAVGWFGNRALNPRSASLGFWAWVWPNPLAFAAIMALGLYLALTRLNFLIAAVLTWLSGFVAPAMLAIVLDGSLESRFGTLLLVSSLLTILTAATWVLASRNLRLRGFLRAK